MAETHRGSVHESPAWISALECISNLEKILVGRVNDVGHSAHVVSNKS
jgi:hypothetical protein